ncbi:hypothetical protein Tco_1111478 [Tanacetum coccineum]|uniref:Uncharacterized protein n=1 Tax=Tanacetum coccineum TaxID=301880 RepID=A0ABQ5ILR1_9ASTR
MGCCGKLTNGAKRKLDHLLLHLVNGLLWKTNDESGTPRSQSGWKTSWAKKDDKVWEELDHLLLHLVNGLLWKNNNVSPEWKILQTLTNGAKRKLDHLLLHLFRVDIVAPEFSSTQNSIIVVVQGLEVGSIRHIQVLDTEFWGFLRVGTTLDIFQNIILIPYLEYGVLSPLDMAY